MFVPKAKQSNEAVAKRKAFQKIKEWCAQIIPMELQQGLNVDVRELVCGDPACAPVDTVITLIWNDGGRGMFGVPFDPMEITQEDFIENFPVAITTT